MSALHKDRDRLVITAWSVVSPFGIGRRAFVDGLTSGRTTDTDVRGSLWDTPDDRACLVPGFDPRDLLGKKGTKAMDRGTGMAVVSVGELIADLGEENGVADRDDTGLVFGTSFGSPQSMMDFTRASLTGAEPFYVDPALMPYGVMNATAGQCAIWHQLRGPNTTLAGGRGVALLGLRYARRLLTNGRAGRVLVGAAEDYSHARSWLWKQAFPDSPTLLGEGAAMLLVEPADSVGGRRRALAEVLAVESRNAFDDDYVTALVDCARSALKSAGVEATDVDVTAFSDAPGRLGEAERTATARVFGRDVPMLPALRALIGETASVSAAFQLGSVLAHGARPGSAGQLAMVTSVDPDGMVACALVRLLDGGF